MGWPLALCAAPTTQALLPTEGPCRPSALRSAALETAPLSGPAPPARTVARGAGSGSKSRRGKKGRAPSAPSFSMSSCSTRLASTEEPSPQA